eukprot:15532-Heterococcus_DN1.PRE.2
MTAYAIRTAIRVMQLRYNGSDTPVFPCVPQCCGAVHSSATASSLRHLKPSMCIGSPDHFVLQILTACIAGCASPSQRHETML